MTEESAVFDVDTEERKRIRLSDARRRTQVIRGRVLLASTLYPRGTCEGNQGSRIALLKNTC